ncbi:hypothetical protein GCM10027425_04580 [Alteromonas gracilis]
MVGRGRATGRHRGPAYSDPGRAHARRLLLERALDAWTDPEPLRCVCVGDDLVIVQADPLGPPPPPWRRHAVDGSWRVRAEDLPTAPTARPAASAVLAPLGTLHDHDVLMDLRAPAGPVALEGDPVVAERVLDRMVRHLVLADHPGEVVVVGRPVSGPWPRRAPTMVQHVAQVPRPVGDAGATQTRALGLQGVILSDARSLTREHRVIALTRPPTAEEESLLIDLSSGRHASIVLVLGPLRHARWRLHASSDGGLEDPVLGLRLDPPTGPTPGSDAPTSAMASPHSVPAEVPPGRIPAALGRR